MKPTDTFLNDVVWAMLLIILLLGFFEKGYYEAGAIIMLGLLYWMRSWKEGTWFKGDE